MEKVRYEIDPHNRLVIEKTGKKADISRFRRVLDGRFKTGPDNSLMYHVKSTIGGTGADSGIPHQVKLRGVWSLSDNHDLKLTLDKWGRQTFGDQLTLQGEILDARKNKLIFAVTTRSKEKTASAYILKLEGAWQADENNRLTFRVNKEDGRHDVLTFNSAWEIGKNYQIIYRYAKSRLTRKRDKTHTITFKGHWDIKDRARVSYVLDKDTHSAFNFTTSLGIFEKSKIKYEIGIGLSDKPQEEKRTLTLFGRWTIKKGVGVTFEVRYKGRTISKIIFGAQARLTERDTVSFKLINEKRNDTGAEIELSHDILKGDGRAFLKLLKSRKEAAIYAGAAWRW
ncbi:MAG: hypothetical protein HQ575_05160 [Candidatus Omnitrophica bacterium]|nr:hypothetical protein [Candidatus Omnitrophota bacterium]